MTRPRSLPKGRSGLSTRHNRAGGILPRNVRCGGPVVGRKNHYGSRSLRGTAVAALFYTLCETAKVAGVDPHAYLLRALYTAIAHRGAVTFPEDLLASTTTA